MLSNPDASYLVVVEAGEMPSRAERQRYNECKEKLYICIKKMRERERDSQVSDVGQLKQ